MDLSKIEAMKSTYFTLSLNGISADGVATNIVTKAKANLSFIPDFVTVRTAGYVDVESASAGLISVTCNFIRDNDDLVSLCVQPITNSFSICPNITHQYVDANQFMFNVYLGNAGTAPSEYAVLSLGLEFVRLKRDKRGEIII